LYDTYREKREYPGKGGGMCRFLMGWADHVNKDDTWVNNTIITPFFTTDM